MDTSPQQDLQRSVHSQLLCSLTNKHPSVSIPIVPTEPMNDNRLCDSRPLLAVTKNPDVLLCRVPCRLWTNPLVGSHLVFQPPWIHTVLLLTILKTGEQTSTKGSTEQNQNNQTNVNTSRWATDNWTTEVENKDTTDQWKVHTGSCCILFLPQLV